MARAKRKSQPAPAAQGRDEIRALFAKAITAKKMTALGNSPRRMHNVAIDLINASGQDWGEVAAGCFMCKATIGRLVQEKTKRPQMETIERILNYYEYRVEIVGDELKPQYRNQPKTKR